MNTGKAHKKQLNNENRGYFKLKFCGIYWVLAVILVLLQLPNITSADNGLERKKVVVIHSYHNGFSWTDGINAGLHESLKQLNPEIYTEFLDSKRNPLKQISATAASYLEKKYKSNQPDLLIISDNNALTFLKDHEYLFPETPIVFCGINNFSQSMIKQFDNRISGVIEKVDFRGTFDLIRLLQPKLKRLVLVSGISQTAVAVRQELKRDLAEMANLPEVVWWSGLSTAELKQRLETTGSGDAVLLILFNRDREGSYYAFEEASRMVSQCANAPVYGMWDFYLSNGVVGGMMVSSAQQGREAGRIASEILITGKISPISNFSPNAPLFDHHSMVLHGLNSKRLPDNAKVYGRTVTGLSKTLYTTVSAAIAFAIVLIAFIVIIYRRLASRTTKKLKNILNDFQWASSAFFILTLSSALLANRLSSLYTTLDNTRDKLIQVEKETLKMMTKQAIDLISYQVQEQKKSGLSEQETQERIQHRIRAINYRGGDGYIFVTSADGVILVNNARPDMEGVNISSSPVPGDTDTFRQLWNAAQPQGGGFHTYTWKKPGSNRFSHKISFVRKTPIYNWIVGTGVYLDSVDKKLESVEDQLWYDFYGEVFAVIIISLLCMWVTYYFSSRLSNEISSESDAVIKDITNHDASSHHYSIYEFQELGDAAGEAFSSIDRLQNNLRSFFDTIDDFFFVLDCDCRIIEINRAAIAKFGISNTELKDSSFFELFDEGLQHKVEEMFAEIIIGGSSDTLYLPLNTSDHSVIEFDLNVFVGEWNDSMAIFVSAKDTSGLRRSEEHLKSVVTGTNVGTWEWNVKTGEVVFNERWAEICGYTLDELAPISIDTWFNLVHPDDKEDLDKALKDHFFGPSSSYNYECRMKHKNGSWLWVHDRGQVLTRDMEDKPAMMYGTHSDISARKEAEAQLTNLLEETTRINRLMVGREDRVIEMKKEVNALRQKQGMEIKYKSCKETAGE